MNDDGVDAFNRWIYSLFTDIHTSAWDGLSVLGVDHGTILDGADAVYDEDDRELEDPEYDPADDDPEDENWSFSGYRPYERSDWNERD